MALIFPNIIKRSLDAWIPKRHEVMLWTSRDSTDGRDIRASTATGLWYDGTDGDACERHGGENNGNAQARLAPSCGKYAGLPGLAWMNDIRNGASMWSNNPGDDDVGGQTAPGGLNKVRHDYITGGPFTRIEHVHVLDCAGYDRLSLAWMFKCMNYEGLAISGAVPNNTKVDFSDFARVAAIGMPAIDSTDPTFSFPRMFRQNDMFSPILTLAPTGGAKANPFMLPGTAATDDLISWNNSHQCQIGDAITLATSTATGLLINTVYYVIAAGFTATTFRVSTVPAGGPVDVTVAGDVTMGLQLKIFTVNTGTDVLTTSTNHELIEGQPVQLWNTGGALPVADVGLYPGNLTAGRTYYARDVTATTLKLAFHPRGTAIDLTGAGSGTHGISVRQHDPGTNAWSPVWHGRGAPTDLNWSPQRWIHGGDLLYVEMRQSVYPGADPWWSYNTVRPTLTFENPGSESAIDTLQGGALPQMMQFGRVYVHGETKQLKLIGPGDVIHGGVKLGYPVKNVGPHSASTAVPLNVANVWPSDLRITGLARIAIVIGSIGIDWGGNWLVSTPRPPAVAPRLHLRGRVIATLSRD